MKTLTTALLVSLLSITTAQASSPSDLQNKIAISNQASLNGASATITINSKTYLYKIDAKGNSSVSNKGKLLEMRSALGANYIALSSIPDLLPRKLTPAQTQYLKKQRTYLLLDTKTYQTLTPTLTDTLASLANQSENAINPSSNLKYEETKGYQRYSFMTTIGTYKTLTFDKKSKLIAAIIRNGSETYTIKYRYGKQKIQTNLKVTTLDELTKAGITL
ncbi:MAG: hypothetical protein ACKOW9_02200 [Candidatus Paceibacterota bacterium]